MLSIPDILRFDATTGNFDIELDEQRHDSEAGRRERLYCYGCRHPITGRDMAMEFNGRHFHSRVNPAGITYDFACYRQAPGCAESGPPIGEHSWFPGYRWQIAVCAACGRHLGWRFRGSVGFYGLIAGRLVGDAD